MRLLTQPVPPVTQNAAGHAQIFPAPLTVALLAVVSIAYVAGYAWGTPNTDSADELMRAYEIRHAIAFPVEGPYLGAALHLGPAWFYLVALPLWLHESWLAAALFIGIMGALKFPLAWYCGRRLLGNDFGVLWAVSLFVPGWVLFEPLLFMNTNAAATAVLAVLALCLRALDRAPGGAGHFALGLTMSLAFHIHPTTMPVFLVAIPVLAGDRAAGRLGAALAALGAGFVLPFVPYLAAQAVAGFPDVRSGAHYVAQQISLASIANAPAVAASYFVTGPGVAARYLARAPEAFGTAVVIAQLGCIACCALAWRAGGRPRAVLLYTTLAFALFCAWIALLRPTTPMWFMMALAPAAAALCALGLWSLAQMPALRAPVAAATVAIVLVGGFAERSMAITVREGEGSLTSRVMDVKGSLPAELHRDVWFPALAHGPLGRELCARDGDVRLHGPLAYVVDRDLGLDTLFACGERARFTMAGGAGTGHVAGMTRPFWRALSWKASCRIGSLGLAPASPLVARRDIAIADGSIYLPRVPSGAPSKPLRIEVSAPRSAAILLTNVLGGYEGFRAVSASVDGRSVTPVASNDLATLYAPAGGPGEGAWLLVVEATAPQGIDIVALEPSRIASQGCMS